MNEALLLLTKFEESDFEGSASFLTEEVLTQYHPELGVWLVGYFTFKVDASRPDNPPYTVTCSGWDTTKTCNCKAGQFDVYCKHRGRVDLVLLKRKFRLEQAAKQEQKEKKMDYYAQLNGPRPFSVLKQPQDTH